MYGFFRRFVINSFVLQRFSSVFFISAAFPGILLSSCGAQGIPASQHTTCTQERDAARLSLEEKNKEVNSQAKVIEALRAEIATLKEAEASIDLRCKEKGYVISSQEASPEVALSPRSAPMNLDDYTRELQAQLESLESGYQKCSDQHAIAVEDLSRYRKSVADYVSGVHSSHAKKSMKLTEKGRPTYDPSAQRIRQLEKANAILRELVSRKSLNSSGKTERQSLSSSSSLPLPLDTLNAGPNIVESRSRK